VAGLERIGRWSGEATRLILFLCIVHFGFWYSLHVFDTENFSIAARRYETWAGINHRNPADRIMVNRQLAAIPGSVLVFVRYWPWHRFQEEWVHNEADIDAARIVWARDLGEPENGKLRDYYPGRSVWLLEPDASPPRLGKYGVAEIQVQDEGEPSAQPRSAPSKKGNSPSHPEMRLENVR